MLCMTSLPAKLLRCRLIAKNHLKSVETDNEVVTYGYSNYRRTTFAKRTVESLYSSSGKSNFIRYLFVMTETQLPLSSIASTGLSLSNIGMYALVVPMRTVSLRPAIAVREQSPRRPYWLLLALCLAPWRHAFAKCPILEQMLQTWPCALHCDRSSCCGPAQ